MIQIRDTRVTATVSVVAEPVEPVRKSHEDTIICHCQPGKDDRIVRFRRASRRQSCTF
jgi:hypothetical protein